MLSPPDRVRLLAGNTALVLGAAGVMAVGTNHVSTATARPGLMGWLLLGTSAGALWFRRRWPTAVMWTTIAAGLAYHALDAPGAFYTVTIVLGIYSAAAFGHRSTAIVGVVVALGTFYAADLIFDTRHFLTPEGALWFGGWLTVGLLMGEVARGRADRIGATERQAREAERHRQEEALRRAGEERMRMARELHDVLAHSISIINVQAGVAVHHLDTDPEKSRAALATVRRTGKQALGELRSSLGVLRDTDAAPPRAPSPGLSDIDQLVAATREAGLTIQLEQHGDLEAIPPDVELAAYRVIQESLTNVTRHAGAAVVTVTIERRPGELLLRVDDDGRGSDGVPDGSHGIIGMRERLRALGGRLDAGPRPEGGFRVEGRMPVRELP